MEDAEILRRLAVVEGWEPVDQGWEWSYGVLADPLEDKEQAFMLLEKHRSDQPMIMWSTDPAAFDTPVWDVSFRFGGRHVYARDKSLQRAICLAIIAAEGEE